MVNLYIEYLPLLKASMERLSLSSCVYWPCLATLCDFLTAANWLSLRLFPPICWVFGNVGGF
jgi:hypothetical protein